jgi:hypothetical protein
MLQKPYVCRMLIDCDDLSKTSRGKTKKKILSDQAGSPGDYDLS